MGNYSEIFWILFTVVFIGTVHPAPKIRTSYFEADEHDLIGSKANLPALPGMDTLLTLPNGLRLTFGKVVALAGDFYGVPDCPIIKPESHNSQEHRERFLAAYGELAVKPRAMVETRVNKLVEMINEDHDAREAGAGDIHDHVDWDRATGGKWVLGMPVVHGTMLKLAAKNFDHFQPQAKKAYLIGHQLAVEKAREAGNEDGEEEKKMKLMKAYSLDAFAGHFLTDCFSSGHIRTPRVKLHEEVTPSKIGDLLSKYMHDEDCKYGLRVKNLRGDAWISYGDGFFLKNGSKDNRQLAEEAMNVSISQVYEAFKHPTRQINATAVTDLLPFIDPAATNNAPLFQIKNDELHLRSSLTDLQASGTTSDWVGVTTANTLRQKEKLKTNSALPAI